MPISDSDRTLLRDLAKRIAEISALPVQAERLSQWKSLNSLRPVRPMVHIHQIPWHEMNVNDELTPRCEDPGLHGMEIGMRQRIYQWEHLQDDQIFDGIVWSGLAIRDTGFGISEDSDVTIESGLASRHFHEQFHTLEDVMKIQIPEVSHDEEATARGFEYLSDLFGDIMPVRKRGITHLWFAPWDLLITWYGVERAMLDMVLNPDLVNACMERLVDGYLARLARWQELNLLSLPSANDGAGSGGLSATDDLPPPDCDPDHVRPCDIWGCATPQIFSEVSPEMHWEFALRHEMRWLQHWGLTYYGCCEPLHTKMDLLRQIPNLRKVSVSPKCDKASMARQLGRDYVASLKPNPAILAMSTWDPEVARRELRGELEQLQGCAVEIVLKDISTVMREPRRLWDWARIARELAEEFAN
ncbi:MAG: hypothetical protein QM473_09605 [Acidobacteriota bacterium]|nr:hypothetical protein [Acidobacteriota bacterium]